MTVYNNEAQVSGPPKLILVQTVNAPTQQVSRFRASGRASGFARGTRRTPGTPRVPPTVNRAISTNTRTRGETGITITGRERTPSRGTRAAVRGLVGI